MWLSAFPFVLSAVLLVRVLVLPEARPASWWAAAVLGAAQGGLCLVFSDGSWSWAVIALGQLVMPPLVLGVYEAAPARQAEASGLRLLLLLLFVAPALVWCGVSPPPAWLEALFTVIPAPAFVWAAGALLCVKEGNFFVRWFFQRLKSSATQAERSDREGTGNGRVIGALERLLIYVFLVTGQSLAVSAIVAVKALARFKRMEEDQAFAEYVIIGTFLSILLALLACGWTVWALTGR